MAVKRTSPAVYDTKYHLVWAPKYRKWVLRGDLRKRVEELFREIAQDFGFAIDTLEVAADHVHLFLDFPPRYSIAKVVGILKSISASQVFEEFPEIKKAAVGAGIVGRRLFCPHGGRQGDGRRDSALHSAS